MLDIRNVAIIAHVDHGKTTLVDEILKQSNFFREGEQVDECFLDKNDLERERGITILAKNIAITYRNTKINLIDTPGHSDFGGQVERVLKLADGVLLLVDAAEGPMPQTRFVLDKALTLGLKPVVIINKVDKPMARVEEVHEKIFDLFVELNASHDQLDFPLLYASGRDGWATDDPDGPRSCILPVLDAILSSIPPPPMREGPVQMQVATLDHSDYLGRIGVGRVYRGSFKKDSRLALLRQRGGETVCAVKQLFTFRGLERVPTDAVQCGDLCAVAGIEELDIGDTLADADAPEALPPISVDEPTMSMVVRVNDSPFYGRESTYSSSRHIRARLFKEAERDVALQVEEVDGDSYKVSGRGILHFSILMENMRREGYEMTVSQPHVIFKNVKGKVHEPMETLSIDVPEESAGKVIELVGMRRGEMTHMEKHGNRQLLDFQIPSRGLIGLRTRVTTASQGEAIMSHRFLRYAEHKGDIPQRTNGVLISMDQGKAVAYAADGLQSRGTLFVGPGDVTYEGMISGEHCKEGDLVVNLQKGKQLTNVRAAGSDRNMQIAPPRRMSLEEALEFIADDELVEVTPESIRLRKRLLTEAERRRQRRSAAKS
ncbi:MAG: translational GTPase TypA [Kiritimatiellia bacterium]|jgi:GTP-binding protein|nr:translational GTPase TypA [Kiritimatiellia bacterium]